MPGTIEHSRSGLVQTPKSKCRDDGPQTSRGHCRELMTHMKPWGPRCSCSLHKFIGKYSFWLFALYMQKPFHIAMVVRKCTHIFFIIAFLYCT